MVTARMRLFATIALCVPVALLLACSGAIGPGQPAPPEDGGLDSGEPPDAAIPAADGGDSGQTDGGLARGCTNWDGGSACSEISCTTGLHSLQENRDRLLSDLARRKCTDRCGLWAALSLAERYIFLMDTAYFGDSASRLSRPDAGLQETALDHAIALYSINAPNGTNLGGVDYNRIYLGFDALAECVMRSVSTAAAGDNAWVKSDDLAGPHPPFMQREMIPWYRAIYDLQSEGPQFHHWHRDSDFSASGIDVRLGVCGVTDRSLTESTIAFDFNHNSDPLGNYQTRGGTGWQIVDQHLQIDAGWDFVPTGCPASPPVNTDQYGGGTFNGMGPVLDGGTCTAPRLGTRGC
jgi:hypothetical protein